MDVGSRTVTRGGQPVKLTHLEFELLLFFARNPSHVFRRDDLFRQVWGQTAGSARTVDNFVGQLRQQPGDRPRAPETLHHRARVRLPVPALSGCGSVLTSTGG